MLAKEIEYCDLQSQINEAKNNGKKELHLENKTYHIHCNQARSRKMNITNTTTESENPEYIKHFGLLFEEMKGFTLFGNGAHIVFHGVVTAFAILNSEDISIKDLTFSFHLPSVTEMTVKKVTDNFAEFKVHNSSKYEIINGGLFWYGENFRFQYGVSQCCDKAEQLVWRQFPSMLSVGNVWEQTEEANIIRANTKLNVKENQVIQMRDSIRTEVGVIMSQSKDIKFEKVTAHFMHGLGIVGQFSENITLDQINCVPSDGRTTAAFADFIQISGCRGLFTLTDSNFSGAHDDVVNVHGTHLKIRAKEENSLTLEFMHGQTFGIPVFQQGDTVAAVNIKTLARGNTAVVTKVTAESPRIIKLELDTQGFQVDDVVENISCNPDVIIRGNYFENIPTRGVLVSTSGKVVIEENHFNRMNMSAILIADDANGWYESGPVTDVTIQKNKFEYCGEPVIFINPENSQDYYVHENIKIIDNTFLCKEDACILSAKGTNGLSFEGNQVNAKYKKEIHYCIEKSSGEMENL